MDVARILFALTIVAASFGLGPALAQSDWANVGPTTVPSISATPTGNDRYGYPQTATRTTAGQPQSIPQRAQNAVTETATSLRDGFQAGTRAVGQQFSGSGTTTYPSYNQQAPNWNNTASPQSQPAAGVTRTGNASAYNQSANATRSTNPFAIQAPAPTTNTQPRNGSQPPPSWPSVASAPSTGSTSAWPGAQPAATTNERSVVTGTTAAPINNNWNGNGSQIAPPPLVVPQVNNTTNNSSSFGNGSGSSYAPDANRNQQSIHSPLVTSPQQPANGTAAPSADWATGWNNNADTTRPSIAGDANNGNPAAATARRDVDLPPLQTIGTPTQQDARKTAAPANDYWPRQQQSSSGAPAIKATPVASTSNSPPMNQQSTNPPFLGPGAIGSAQNSANSVGQTPGTTQAANGTAVANRNPATGEPQPWVPLVISVLALAGSIAGNLFLGWSYLDARQKYQSLVRRTADTFRRTQPAAA